jgi:hypothetical protein
MPRICAACAHPRRDDIDRAIIDGRTLCSIARDFGLSPHTVGRHARIHLRARLAPLPSAGADTQDGPIATGIIEEPIAAFFRARRIAELTSACTLRDHALRDLERLEAVLAAAVASNNVPAILATLRTKWIVADRAGLVENSDRPLRGSIGHPNPRVAAVAAQFLRHLQARRNDALGDGA